MAEWLQVKSIEMLVSKSEFEFELNKNTGLLFFSCDLLNIARGRCDLVLKEQLQADKNEILISTEKPIMKAEISLTEKKFENIIKVINRFSYSTNKKIKIILYLNKTLAVNNHGFLSLENDIKLEIINFKLILPFI